MEVFQNLAENWQDYRTFKNGHQHTVVGTLKVLDGVRSVELKNRRPILIYLPPSYNQMNKRFPVIYMHDGQNLFDRFTSYSGEWEVDETLERLSRQGLEAIVVGIPHAGEHRIAEYTPFVDRKRTGGRGETYLSFVVETVKPLVDRDFRTLNDKDHTGIMGSSMGGLISLYAFFRYPEIFGFAGAMSPYVMFATGAIFPYVEKIPFNPGRVYLDVGTREEAHLMKDEGLFQSLSKHYRDQVRHMRDLLTQKGYRPGHSLLYVEDEGAIHHESAWARRLPQALSFLLQTG
jgi:predicted alpha/beta superfamily hydrolase